MSENLFVFTFYAMLIAGVFGAGAAIFELLLQIYSDYKEEKRLAKRDAILSGRGIKGHE